VREVGWLLRIYAGASDVTVAIELADGPGTLLMALQAASVFVGLVKPRVQKRLICAQPPRQQRRQSAARNRRCVLIATNQYSLQVAFCYRHLDKDEWTKGFSIFE
jgi:hypothetical protein